MPTWAKRLLVTLAIAGGLLVVLGLAVPLVLRGSRLAWLVQRGTSSLCGTIRIDGGRFSVTALFDLLIGRPTPVEIDGLRVVAPDGEEVLATARLGARVRVRFRPLRADVYDLRLSSVRWVFVEHPEQGRVDFVDVFKSVPAGGRAQCLAPPPPQASVPQAPAKPTSPPPPVSVEVHDAVLEDLDLRLDFAMWALVLDGTSAEGNVGFKSNGPGPRLHFEVRGVEARRGGSLRVGPRGPLAAQVPFDHVQIDRYATLDEAPADMLLEVGRASTGRSALSGRAQFTNIFPWGRRARAPGLDLDARWTDVGDVVQGLKRVWGLEKRLPGRLDGDISAKLRGPFTALVGQLHAAGPHAQFDLGLERNLRVDAQVQLDGLETDGVLDPALAPLLAGRLSGHLRSHVQFAPRPLDLAGALDEATIRLDRTRGGPWPTRLVVSTHALPGDSTPDEIDLFLSGARFERGALSLREVRANVAGAPLHGAVSARLFDDAGVQLPVPVIDARADAHGLALDRVVPGGLVRGRVSVATEIHGPTDALALVARFPAGSSLQLWTQPLALPRRIEARLRDGDRLTLSPLRLGEPATGAIDLGGTADFNGPVDARVGVLRYPIERLLALTGLQVTGRLDSGLHVTGPTRRPRVDGQLALSDVRVNGALLGDGAVTLVSDGAATSIDGRLVPALGLHGRLAFPRGPLLTAHLLVDQLPLAPFAGVPGFSGQLSAEADARVDSQHVDATADVTALALTYQVPHTALGLGLHNEGVAHLRATERGLTLSSAHLRGDGLDLVVDGALDRDGLRAQAAAQVSIPAFAALLRPWIRETAGVVAVDVRAVGPLSAPAVSGVVSVREPLRLWPSALIAPVQVPSGAVAFAGTRLEARALTLSFASASAQVDGTATLAPALGETQVDLDVRGAAEGSALARRLPAALTDGRGRITVAGHVGGTATVPSFDGHVDFAGFGARIPDAPVELRRIDGRVEARGHTLSTSGLALSFGPAGQLQIGAPDAPAIVEISGVQPPDVGPIAIHVRAHDLATSAPVSGLRVQALDLQVSLDHAIGGPLRVAGDVWVQGASLAVQKGGVSSGAPALKTGGRVAKELFPDILLDVRLRSKKGALAVMVPWVPDLSLTLDCRVAGSYRRPQVGGQLRGDGLYSRLALFLYDTFTNARIRRCGAK